MADEIEFTLNGKPFRLSRSGVVRAMNGVEPEPIHTHSVIIGGVEYPVKQAFDRVTGEDRLDFISTAARRQFRRLEFEVRRRS